jgi:hypothetical protein
LLNVLFCIDEDEVSAQIMDASQLYFMTPIAARLRSPFSFGFNSFLAAFNTSSVAQRWNQELVVSFKF